MTPQTFALGDLPVIGLLVLLEGLLSADNALVLALMVRHLPSQLQRKALLYGLGGAFVFRLVAILLATWIIRLWWLQAIGAAYLLYLLVKHFVAHNREASGEGAAKARTTGFWQTVVLVEFTDIAFAIDSVVAAVGIVSRADKLWLIYLGAVIGIVLLRFAATAFINLLEKFPPLEHMAYVLVGWVGVKLAFMAGENFVETYNADNKVPLPFHVPHLDHTVFWSGMVLIIASYTLFGLYDRRRRGIPTTPEPPASE